MTKIIHCVQCRLVGERHNALGVNKKKDICNKCASSVEVSWSSALPTQFLGGMGELVVATDLISRGFYVFRAMVAAGPDLVAMRDASLFRVEVKASFEDDSYLSTVSFDGYGGKSRYDILALVERTAIRYLTQSSVSALLGDGWMTRAREAV